MTIRFRPWDPKQKWLLPPGITEFIPEGRPAHFVRDLVVEELDLAAMLDSYVEDKGYPPFHPAMMVALLLYAYTQGVFSSRKIAKACIERMDFAAVTGFQKPDNEFAEVVKGWLDQAEITDLGEDFRFRNRQGGELPAWVVNKAERMKKIREAKAALEQEAAAKAKEEENKPKKNGKPGSLVAAMRDKLRRGGWRSPYRLRKQVVEPVFGQIKQAMGFRQFLLRGLTKVKAEWQLVCTAHNLLKLVRATA